MRQKMLLSYNVSPEHQDEYMQFAVQVFLPTLQRIGLENQGVWHTAWGDYPTRLIVFVAEEQDMHEAVTSDTWEQLETRLRQYVSDYTRRIVPFQPGFQF